MLPIPKRFYSLDVVRGLAALSIVFWHWQHFFPSGNYEKKDFPFYHLFFVFYEQGEIAVDFFFALSGFIFFFLYSQPVSARKISAWDFAVKRFSRLYPLHFATLIFVLIGQQWLLRQTGRYFVYGQNDIYHFILNLFFISQWGFQRGLSFNGPVWSVSIEVFLYALFFIVCRLRLARSWFLLMFLILGLGVHHLSLGRGIFPFFLGGLVYEAYQKIVRSGMIRNWKAPLIAGMCLAWISVVVYQWADIITFPPRWGTLIMNALVFPISILSLVVWETHRGHLGKRFSLLGDISYSSYLLHFPMQLACAGLLLYFGISQTVFYSEFALLAFFLILIFLSALSHKYFEMPAQNFLRKKQGAS